MKKLLYKGIEFDDFQLYNGEPERYGDYNSESLDGFECADVYVCPHCIKKYGLYTEAETSAEAVEKYVNGEYDDGDCSMVCGVKGCYNGNSYDCCLDIAGCSLTENE